ncbi:MAG: lipid A biosynthesis acyltransferase [Roseiarcus sp.]|jgi:KDO2-lipid IV(A) lauroyltransferase
MPLVKRLRHKIEYIALLALAALIRALPVETASRWSGAGWRLVAPRLHRHKRALKNLSLAFPEKPPAEIEAIAVGMWDSLGRTFAEFFHLDEIVNGGRIRFEPPELFEAIRGRGDGGVACSLHMANWEIVSQAGPPLGWRPAGVYQKIVNPFVDRYVNAVRAPLYPGGLWAKSPQVARNILRYAREGGCAAVLADQRDPKGLPAPFFGRPALSTTLPASVARAVGVPLYAFRVKRVSDARFSIRVEEVAAPRTNDRDADIAAATRNLQATFEAMIREAPEQWMWAQSRWG